MKTVTEQHRRHDFLIWELAKEHGWCRELGTISQDAGATDGLEPGQVLEDDAGDYQVCATGANANAILLVPITLEDLVDGDVDDVPLLVRGPALVIEEELIIDAAQLANALTALAVLDIEVRSVPAKQTEGTLIS